MTTEIPPDVAALDRDQAHREIVRLRAQARGHANSAVARPLLDDVRDETMRASIRAKYDHPAAYVAVPALILQEPIVGFLLGLTRRSGPGGTIVFVRVDDPRDGESKLLRVHVREETEHAPG